MHESEKSMLVPMRAERLRGVFDEHGLQTEMPEMRDTNNWSGWLFNRMYNDVRQY